MGDNLNTSRITQGQTAPVAKWFPRAQLAALAFALTSGWSASALIFDLNYSPDSTFTAAGLSAADIVNMKAANNFVASLFAANFTDNIHVNINVTAVPGTGTLGASSTSIAVIPFANLRTAVLADATTANDTTAISAGGSFPVSDPIGGAHSWIVSRAQSKALGLAADDAVTADGTFTFGGGFSYTYDPNNRAVAGKFDYIGIALHEYSEIMGRIGLMGANLDGNPDYMMMDLFHYTGAATRGLNNGGGRFFSINNGTTLLKGFNNASVNGGDLQDWASGANDAFNAFGSAGALNALTSVDLVTLDVIGYNLAVPEPSAGILAVSALAIAGFVRRQNKATKFC